MCGIFGICYKSSATVSTNDVHKILDHLFRLSQSRGKEASGLLVNNGTHNHIYKDTISGERFILTRPYQDLFKNILDHSKNNIAIIGHARLDTNGSKWDNANNSPLEYNGSYGIHNGIVTNVDELWAQNPTLPRHRVVDSEVILALFDQALQHGKNEQEAIDAVFKSIIGSASVAIFSENRHSLSLATNTGSLYFTEYGDDVLVFASESYILQQVHKKSAVLKKCKNAVMRQILPGTSVVINLDTFTHNPYQGRVVHALL